MIKILVIGRHPQIMETVLRLINGQENWKGVGALTDGEAKIKFENENFDLILIGGGVEDKSEKELSTVFKGKNPTVKIVRHFGGGSGLLFNEIQQAISN
jgi:DNA-binding NarL/FixJ family response regulator